MNNKKIGLFFGGKITGHLVLVRRAAKKLGVDLELISYNRVCFDTESGKVMIRGNGDNINVKKSVDEYNVLFFRTTGKHWEEVDLIVNQVKSSSSYKVGEKPIIIDPIVEWGKPSYACKAYQMLALKETGIDVPKSIYGSLWYLYEQMRTDVGRPYSWPVIIKGSGGDRGTRVFKADNLEELEKLVRDLRKTETDEGKRYMLQEYIPNDGDYRVIVLGDRVLGVMKRSSQSVEEFRNNYSAGGKVEIADLPDEIKALAVKAAKVCGLAVAGVDVAFRDFDKTKPVIWEVNKGPQFKGFMAATGIDVPKEIVKFLVSQSGLIN
ncbi:MAG TPA: hypothetical protein PK639_04635 [Candidatus Woesebacteria bacterium]|nr:hypothetical protein [Candidatus Woesebacteria bacterium]